MSTVFREKSTKSPFKGIVLCVAVSFSTLTILPPEVCAQLPGLPAPGTLVQAGPNFTPPIVRGMTIHPDNPFQFDFIIDSGDPEPHWVQGKPDPEIFKQESEKLIKYFLASLTVPEDEMWVNLSPHEPDRIIPEGFGKTEMGRDLLAQDYILKQLAASLAHPEKIGEAFDLSHKVWIVPDKASVYVHDRNVFVVDAKLKVMMEEDYEASRQRRDAESRGSGLQDRGISKALIRKTILPEIEREVNEGAHFAKLRQIYHSSILATWYKKNLRNSILNKVYIDQNKTKGVDHNEHDATQKIYDQYLQALKKGVYNFIKEEHDPVTNEIIPRKYFSGGADMAMNVVQANQAMATQVLELTDNAQLVSFRAETSDQAMQSFQVDGIDVSFEQQSGVATITFTHLRRGNLLTKEIYLSLGRILDQLEREEDVRAIILSGGEQQVINPVFSWGVDLNEWDAFISQGDYDWVDHMIQLQQEVEEKVRNFPKPVVAIVNGTVMGAAFGLASMADIVVAEHRTNVGIRATWLGYVPVSRTVHYFRSRMPEAAARYHILTGNGIAGKEAAYYGLADIYIENTGQVDGEHESVVEKIESLFVANADIDAEGLVVQLREWDPVQKALEDREGWGELWRTAKKPALDESQRFINKFFGRDHVRLEDVLEALEREGQEIDADDPAENVFTFHAQTLLDQANPVALWLTNFLFYYVADARDEDIANAELELARAVVRTPAFAEGLRAFNEKRKPVWAIPGNVDQQRILRTMRGSDDGRRLLTVARSIDSDLFERLSDDAAMMSWKDLRTRAEIFDAIAQRKSEVFHAVLERIGVERYEATVRLIQAVKAAGYPVNVASSSRSSKFLLTKARVMPLLDEDKLVDGNTQKELGFRSKPASDMFDLAAERVGISPLGSVVIEDQPSGVLAGVSGGYTVIALNREGNAQALRDAGAHLVLDDLEGFSLNDLIALHHRVKGDDVPFEGLILDNDGVIVHAEPIHFQAYKEIIDSYLAYRTVLLNEQYRPLTEAEYFRHIAARGVRQGLINFFAARRIEPTLQDLEGLFVNSLVALHDAQGSGHFFNGLRLGRDDVVLRPSFGDRRSYGVVLDGHLTAERRRLSTSLNPLAEEEYFKHIAARGAHKGLGNFFTARKIDLAMTGDHFLSDRAMNAVADSTSDRLSLRLGRRQALDTSTVIRNLNNKYFIRQVFRGPNSPIRQPRWAVTFAPKESFSGAVDTTFERVMDYTVLEELVVPGERREFVRYIEELLVGEAEFKVIFKPIFNVRGNGVFFLERDKDGTVTLTTPGGGESLAIDNVLDEMDFRDKETIREQNIVVISFDPKQDNILAELERVWERISTYRISTYDPGFVEEYVESIKVDGRAYGTRHFLEVDPLTGEVRLLKNQWFARIGSSFDFDNYLGREGEAQKIPYEDGMYHHLEEHLEGATLDVFERDIDAQLIRIAQYFLKQLQQEGVILGSPFKFAVDFLWTPRDSGDGVEPVLAETYLESIPNLTELGVISIGIEESEEQDPALGGEDASADAAMAVESVAEIVDNRTALQPSLRIERIVTVKSGSKGIHGRPSGVISSFATAVEDLFSVRLFFQGRYEKVFPANSFAEVAILLLGNGDSVRMIAEGKEQERTLNAILDIFGELLQDPDALELVDSLEKYIDRLKTLRRDARDFASISNPGGIDLNPGNVELKEGGGEIEFNFPALDPALLNAEIDGLYPVIINISPVTNLPALLGLVDDEDTDQLSFQRSLAPMDRKKRVTI